MLNCSAIEVMSPDASSRTEKAASWIVLPGASTCSRASTLAVSLNELVEVRRMPTLAATVSVISCCVKRYWSPNRFASAKT